MEKLTLQDLLVKHDYYCSDSNYYSRDAQATFETFSDFIEEWGDADLDYNLVFRWDLQEKDGGEGYYMEIFIIQQRKGIFFPIHILSFDENDVDVFIKYIQPYIDKLKSIWKPFDF